MDLQKAIKPELIGIWDQGQIRASLTWYDRAKREIDMEQQDYFNNCALFRSKTIAKQETMKMHQKERHNKVISHDSGSVIMLFNTSKMGLDKIRSKKYSSQSFADEGNLPCLICDNGRGSQWISEGSREVLISESFPVIEILQKISNMKDSIKLVVAWFIMRSDYINHLVPAHFDFWNNEFRLLEIISDQNSSLSYKVLWEYTCYSRLEIERSNDVVRASIKELYPEYNVINKQPKIELDDEDSDE